MMEHPCPPYIRMRSLLAEALRGSELFLKTDGEGLSSFSFRRQVSGGKRMRKTVALLASVTLALLLASSVALAAASDLPDEGTVGANGRIFDILVSDGKVYLAGSFTQLTDTDGTTVAR